MPKRTQVTVCEITNFIFWRATQQLKDTRVKEPTFALILIARLIFLTMASKMVTAWSTGQRRPQRPEIILFRQIFITYLNSYLAPRLRGLKQKKSS